MKIVGVLLALAGAVLMYSAYLGKSPAELLQLPKRKVEGE
jgi:hypothetical protein